MLKRFAEYLTYDIVRLEQGRLADALVFFTYDTIKIFFLLSVVIFFISILRSYFSPEKTRRFPSVSILM